MDSKYIVGVITIAVTAMLVGSVLIPVIDTSSRGGTEYEDNPDWDGWIRFDLNRSASAAYEINITQDENGIYVGAGTDVQAYDDSSTGEYATIFYADSNTVVWADDGDAYKIMGTSNGSPVYFTTSDDLTISRDSNGVSVSDGVNSYAFDTPSWAYVPKSTGTYGFYPYDSERGVSVSDDPAAVVGGGFAGVYAYNDTIRFGIDLSMVPIIADGMYYGATWEKVADTPDDVQITPLDPSIIIPGGDSTQPIVNPIDPDPDAEIMSVPTPTYTEGDWGYDIIQVNGVDKAAIVSYSGTGGNIVVPATIAGYDVYRFGKSAPDAQSGSNNVINPSSITNGSTITFSEGIVQIGRYALGYSTANDKLTGSLVIPSTVTDIGANAFRYCRGFTGTLTIPSSVTFIGSYAFYNCSKLTGTLTIPSSVTFIGQDAFGSCSSFTGTLTIPPSITSLSNNTFTNCTGITTLIIPSSVTSIGSNVFYNCGAINAVISSDAVPGETAFRLLSASEVLDLSDVVDYSVDRYGIPDTTVVSDSIGDSFGFVASTTVVTTIDNPITPYKSLLYAIPVIVLIVGLLIMAGFVIAKRDY